MLSVYWFAPKHTDLPSLMLKGDQYFREKKYTESIESYLAALESYPKNEYEAILLLKIGDIYNFGLSNNEKSIKAYQLLISKFPHSIEARNAYIHQGDLYASLGDYEKALLSYQELVNKFPNMTNVVEFELKVAKATLKLKRFEPARRILMRLYEQTPDGPMADQVLFQLMVSFFTEGGCEQTKKVLQTFYERHAQSPLMPEAKFYEANCLEEQGDIEAALEIYKKIRDQYPNPLVVEQKMNALSKKIKDQNSLRKNVIQKSLQEIQNKLNVKKKDPNNTKDEFYLFEPRAR